MHAGVINGGGFLLVRFSPLYASQPLLLHGIFVVGLITAVAGSFWKLIQTDIKRMLVCSTIGQMGFMLMQCGMGLFAPAFSHLVWHGIFKAYLFLNAGSVLKEKRIAITTRLSPLRIAVACCSGAIGALAFAVISETDLSFDNTSCMMILLAFMATTQLAIGLLEKPVTIFRTAGTFLTGIGAGALYGFNVRLIESTLAPLHTPKPQPMDAIYFTGFAVIVLVWMAMILKLPTRLQSQSLWKRLYMEALNASQPHPSTVSATRTTYQS
jgi:NAD(P)H-quinone oxidoreductase subunit 5